MRGHSYFLVFHISPRWMSLTLSFTSSYPILRARSEYRRVTSIKDAADCITIGDRPHFDIDYSSLPPLPTSATENLDPPTPLLRDPPPPTSPKPPYLPHSEQVAVLYNNLPFVTRKYPIHVHSRAGRFNTHTLRPQHVFQIRQSVTRRKYMLMGVDFRFVSLHLPSLRLFTRIA